MKRYAGLIQNRSIRNTDKKPYDNKSKSTGVFKTIIKTLNAMHFLDGKTVAVSHSVLENAQKLAGSLDFESSTKVLTFGKEELLQWMSNDYRNCENPEKGWYEYYLNKDCVITEDGVIRSNWGINQIPPENVPSVIFIDEWSRYTQPEIDLIQRFAEEYGIQVIAAGDLDQLSPKAYLSEGDIIDPSKPGTSEMTIARSITPFVPKLGVSMRTGNGQKTANLYTVQARLKHSSKDSIELMYVETDQDLYGDKVHQVGNDYTDAQLTEIKQDIDKMIANLNSENNEKIGYIYHDPHSKLFQLLSSQEYKDKIDFKNEAAAQGNEARYYIVENDRRIIQDSESYLRSLYTGISRAEQASIVIASNQGIGTQEVRVIRPSKRENRLIPDGFNKEGIARFSKARAKILDDLYKTQEIPTIDIVSRTKHIIPLNSKENGVGSGLNNLEQQGRADGEQEPIVQQETEQLEEATEESGQSNEVNEGQNAETPAQEAEVSTQLEPNIENCQKFVEAVYNRGVASQGNILFDAQVIAQDLNTTLENISLVLQELANKHVITQVGNTTYNLLPNNLQEIQMKNPNNTEEERPVIEFEIGDSFSLGNPVPQVYDITGVIWSEQAKDFMYTLENGVHKTNIFQKALSALARAGKCVTKEEQYTPEGDYRQPQSASNFQGQEALERVVDECLSQEEKPLREIQEVAGDLDYPIFGYTWNTNYIGVKFDEQTGKPITEGRGSNRIDNANGLIKLAPNKFTNEDSCRKALGLIRQSLMFDSNEDIIQTVKSIIPKLKDTELECGWYFISKSKKHGENDGGRYYYDPEMLLDNMEDKEHADIPIKMISFLIKVKNGPCVLELPIATLGSPFTALYNLNKNFPENPIGALYKSELDKYKNGKDQVHPGVARTILEKIITEIDTLDITKKPDGSLKTGYKRLQDICKLWLFTSDGIRYITNKRGVPFNFHSHGKNTGVHYVTNRFTEREALGSTVNHDYTQKYHSMEIEEKRTDVNYSDIMISPNDRINGIRVVASGHPFILRSDSMMYTDNESMMTRYLEQLKDPSLEPIVKLEILTPPEISISQYLVERRKGRGCNYGNEFTAYRILSVLQQTDTALFNQLDPSLKSQILPLMRDLDRLQDEFDQAPDENRQQLMTRIYKAQKAVMGKEGVKLFSEALSSIVQDTRIPGENTVNFQTVAARIEQDCSKQNPKTGKPYLTGALYRPVCKKKEDAGKVGGFGILVVTGPKSRFTTPDGNYYRIFSRYDTPIFDLSILGGDIATWVTQMVEGAVPDNPNVWKFIDTRKDGKIVVDFAEKFYTADDTTETNIKDTPNQELKNKYSDILEKLKLKDYNKLDTIENETDFLKAIRDKYVETPGNIAVIDGNKLICTDLKNIGVTGSNKIPDELASAIQISFESNNLGDYSYTLTLQTSQGTLDVDVALIPNSQEIVLDLSNFVKRNQPKQQFDFAPIFKKLDQILAMPRTKKDQVQKIKDSLNTLIAENKSIQEIAEFFKDDAFARNILKELYNTALNQEQEEDVCFVIHKKYV